MTGIRFHCPTCNKGVDIPPRGLLLAAGDDDTSWYAFQCPVCSGIVDKPATRCMVSMLVWSGGSPTTVGRRSPGRDTSGPR